MTKGTNAHSPEPIKKRQENTSISSLETVRLERDEQAPKGRAGSGSLPIIEAGSYFAGYKIIRKIAQGAMGVVYLAEDTTLHRKVAIKVILTAPGMQATEEQVTRFLREARSIAQLRHKHIVPIYEVDAYEHCQYFTMEYIEGPTLEQFMVKNEITAAKAIEIIKAIAEGLQEAHSKNIVHRDIKPANIMMQHGVDPMITDFGLAKILEHEQKLTLTGSMLGTPCYMSPEQARGDADLDQKSDIFSLGVLLYEMVTEKLPFKGESYMKTALKVIEGNYVMPRMLKPRLSRDVENIIKKSLEKDREYRYQSMTELIEDCMRFQRGEVVVISKSGVYRKFFHSIVRNRISIFMSILIVSIIGYLMMRNFDQSQVMNDQKQSSIRASKEKEIASREKEQISKEKQQLEIQGELLKRGTTIPEFAERFDDEKHFNSNWLISWSPAKVKNNSIEMPAKKKVFLSPKAGGFSASAIFSWKTRIAQGNKLYFYCGFVNPADSNVIDKPFVFCFQTIKKKDNDSDTKNRLRIEFYQIQSKAPFSRLEFNLAELPGFATPIANREFDIPNNVPDLLYFSVKRYDTLYEITIKEKEGFVYPDESSFQRVFRISSMYYLNVLPMHCGFFAPETNPKEIALERFRVDKWIAGSSEIEINRIIENNWKSDYKQVIIQLQKYQDQLDLAIYVADNPQESVDLKYQLAKTTFLKGMIYQRNFNSQMSKEDIASMMVNYENTYTITQDYLLNNPKSAKTEFINYEELHVAVMAQMVFFNVLYGDFKKASQLLKVYQDYLKNNTPYHNWMWNLFDPIEKSIASNRQNARQKLPEKMAELYTFLEQIDFNNEEMQRSNIYQEIQVLIRDTVNIPDLDLFEKYSALLNNEESKKYLIDLISKEISKEKISSLLLLNVLQTYEKIFKTSQDAVVGNYMYEGWSTIYEDKNNKTWREHCEELKEKEKFQNVLKRYSEFGTVFESSTDKGIGIFNSLIANHRFRKEFLTSVLDDLNFVVRLNNKQIDALGEIFPINLSFDQSRGGNINLSLDDNGIKIRIITKDNELKNRMTGKMINQEDCWQLFFDFRQGSSFLSNQESQGVFSVNYAPIATRTADVRLFTNGNLPIPKFEVLNFSTVNRIIQQNEIVLFLPFSEVYKLTGGSNLRAFGFNAILTLESGGKIEFRTLFPTINKKLFSIGKASGLIKESLFTDRDLENELLNVYQQADDSYQDKIMVKKIFDHWLEINPSKPLFNDSQLEKIYNDLLNNFVENFKRGVLKKIMDDAFSVLDSVSIFQGMRGKMDARDSLLKNISDKVLSCLDVNLTAMQKNAKANTNFDSFFEELKRARVFLKYTDTVGRKNYYQFLERFLTFWKIQQPNTYEIIYNYFMQMPDVDFNDREKSIVTMTNGMLSESLFFLKKHLESNYRKDDEIAFYDYEVLRQLAQNNNIDISITGEINEELSRYFGKTERNIEVDIGLTLNAVMLPQEFNAKYPFATTEQSLLLALLNDIPNATSTENIIKSYESYLKSAKPSWLTVFLKNRIATLKKIHSKESSAVEPIIPKQ